MICEVEDVGGVGFLSVAGEDDGAGWNVDRVGGGGVRGKVEGGFEFGGNICCAQ